MRLETTHVLKLRLEVSKQGHALRRNFAPKIYGSMKNKQVKANSVEQSLPLGQAVSLGRLSSHSRVTTDRQSATWSDQALGRGARSKNQRHSPLDLEVGTLEVSVEDVWRYVKN